MATARIGPWNSGIEAARSKGARSEAVIRLLILFPQLDKHHLGFLREIYSPDIAFSDPAHHISGLPELERYFEHLYANLRQAQIQINSVQEHDGEAWLTWSMTLCHSRLNGSRPFSFDGVTHLRFSDQVYWHRDYFDMGAMLYERLPLLGPLIGWIKRGVGGAR
ncbi:nuclear transport factor 2 family protein [Pseudaeromonas sharmana]|uniref:Nuclear transport factor 2 family protein n=1 Tax=Pseudaeromonas sharmana TaxID=328412 RepID=A0ABV8CQB2_9GAMM